MTGENVLFRSPNWLGDAVMATVIPPAIKRAHPQGRVGVLTPPGLGDIFRGHPAVDEVVEFEPGHEVDAYRRGGYDRVLLGPVSFGSAWRALRGGVRRRAGFGGSGRGVLLDRRLPGQEYRRDRHQVENYRALASLVGKPDPGDEPGVHVSAERLAEADSLWGSPAGPRVALQPGATYGPAKRWAAGRFAAVARELSDAGSSVAILGGPADREAVEAVLAESPPGVIDLAGRTTIGTLAAVLARSDLLVTNDTGPMHLGAAVGTLVLAIFGSTDPGWTAPWGKGHIVMRHPVECSPCFRRTCRIGYPCLENIAAGDVARTARELLEDRS